jgi:hypothetical protein
MVTPCTISPPELNIGVEGKSFKGPENLGKALNRETVFKPRESAAPRGYPLLHEIHRPCELKRRESCSRTGDSSGDLNRGFPI